MKTYATREEAIKAEVIAPLEARGAEHVQINWDLEAIAEELVYGTEGAYTVKANRDGFWWSTKNNERRNAQQTSGPWFNKDVWTGWVTTYKNKVLAYVLVVKEDVNEDEVYKDGEWAYCVEEMFYSTNSETGRKQFYLTGNWSEFDNLDSAEKYILKMVSR